MFVIEEDTRLTTKIELNDNFELFFYVPDELYQKVKFLASVHHNRQYRFIFQNSLFGFRFDINYDSDTMAVILDSYMLKYLNWVVDDTIYINENDLIINFTKE